jgi:ABC-type branched-subunit amino acid transport system substrate-binding protein
MNRASPHGPRTWKAWLVAFAGALAAPALWAQIVIGQTAGFSGTVAAGVQETAAGAKLYIDAVNVRGGVNGHTLTLVSLDDKFDPKLAAENARKLITENKVTALFLTRGTPHTEAIAPLLAEFKVLLVAPSTGAMVLHNPVNPYIFNVRATYQREAEQAVRHLATIGLTRIAIVQVDDSFGSDAAIGAAKGLSAAKLTPVLQEKFNRSQADFSAIGPNVAKSEAQAVLFLASGQAVADGVKAIRHAGSKAQIVTLSNNAASGFVKQMGEYAYGTIVSQVFPSERSGTTPLVNEATALLKAKGGGSLSPAMLEGFAAAKVLVEGLRRAGPAPTREKLVAALNSMNRFDVGGMELSYSPANHTGLDFSDLSIIDDEGRFRR